MIKTKEQQIRAQKDVREKIEGVFGARVCSRFAAMFCICCHCSAILAIVRFICAPNPPLTRICDLVWQETFSIRTKACPR